MELKADLKQYALISLTPVLKESRSETRSRSAGSLFQRTMDMGENEYL